MDGIMIIILCTCLGAFIGGWTNFIAISMLFRPYKHIYLGSWKVPFTPGLIPKRHRDIAYQLGELVEKELIPLEVIRKRIVGSNFQEKLEEWFTKELQRIIHTKQNLGQVLHAIQKRGCLDSLFSEETKVGRIIEPLADYILFKIEEFLYSEEGENFLYASIQEMIGRQGGLANIMGLFLAKDKLVDRLRPILLHALRKPSTKNELQRQLDLAFEELMNKDIEELLQPMEKDLLAVVPTGVSKLMDLLDKQISIWISALDISRLVREQVLDFPLERVEKLIRGLAKRELKMITWLGALLGGLIGFIQAIIVTMLR